MTNINELQIVTMLRDPKTRDKGFTLLMDTYKEPVYWHIRRLVVSHEDAEDILQETFINAHRYAAFFNGNSKLFSWLYRIATNECIRLFRKNKGKSAEKFVIGLALIDKISESQPENSENILAKFQKAILMLPEKQRLVFNMRYYDELKYQEISEILGSSVNSMKTNYHYATKKIKEYLKNS